MTSGPNRKVWLVLVAVLFGHTLLVASPGGETRRSGVVRTLVMDGLTPVEKLFDTTVHGIGAIWNSYFNLLDTRRENERLKTELADLQMERDRASEAVREAARLRRLLDLAPLVNADRLVARVIGRDTTTSRQTVTIDKGTFHGVHTNAPVVTPEGIVGRVIHTGHYSAIVQLISDADSGVGVIAASSRIQGIVRGDGTRYLEMEHVDDHLELSPGEGIVTSGTDRIYPKGLPVGIVAANGPDQGLMKTARIEPSADLERLEEVLCLVAIGGATRLQEDFQNSARPNQKTP